MVWGRRARRNRNLMQKENDYSMCSRINLSGTAGKVGEPGVVATAYTIAAAELVVGVGTEVFAAVAPYIVVAAADKVYAKQYMESVRVDTTPAAAAAVAVVVVAFVPAEN